MLKNPELFSPLTCQRKLSLEASTSTKIIIRGKEMAMLHRQNTPRERSNSMRWSIYSSWYTSNIPRKTHSGWTIRGIPRSTPVVLTAYLSLNVLFFSGWFFPNNFKYTRFMWRLMFRRAHVAAEEMFPPGQQSCIVLYRQSAQYPSPQNTSWNTHWPGYLMQSFWVFSANHTTRNKDLS